MTDDTCNTESNLEYSGLRKDELISIQNDLRQERGVLVDIKQKIEAQIHALQVEQLHLKSSIYSQSEERNELKIEKAEMEDPNIMINKLDLSIPNNMMYEEEEEDEDEDEDENE